MRQKEKSKGMLCDLPNINGNQLEQIVCEEILQFDVESSLINQKLKSLQKQTKQGASATQIALDSVKSQIQEKRVEIDNLIQILSQSEPSGKLYEYTSKKVEKLNQEIFRLKQEEFRLEKEAEVVGGFDQQFDIIYDALKCFARTFETSTTQEKSVFLRSIIEKIVWDGKEIHIFL